MRKKEHENQKSIYLMRITLNTLRSKQQHESTKDNMIVSSCKVESCVTGLSRDFTFSNVGKFMEKLQNLVLNVDIDQREKSRLKYLKWKVRKNRENVNVAMLSCFHVKRKIRKIVHVTIVRISSNLKFSFLVLLVKNSILCVKICLHRVIITFEREDQQENFVKNVSQWGKFSVEDL